MLKEEKLCKILRVHLINRGWRETNDLRKIGQHGWDVSAFHPKWRKVLLIECKGDSEKHNNNNKIQNSFWTSIGQIVARMDKQGNCPKKARIYAIGIPVDWAGKFRNRAKKMKYGWDFLKLRIFLVDENGFVEEKTYKQFLKQ